MMAMFVLACVLTWLCATAFVRVCGCGAPSAHEYVTSGDGGFQPSGKAKDLSRCNNCRVNFAKVGRAAEQLSFAPTMPLDYLTLQDLQRDEQTARVLAVSAGASFIALCGHMNLPSHHHLHQSQPPRRSHRPHHHD